jgi:hypothetical protein
MTQPLLTDRDVKAMFDARAAGTVDPDLAGRIHAAAAATRQRRRLLGMPAFGGPMRTFALAAVLGASSLALIGALIIGGTDDTPTATPPPSGPPVTSPSPSPSPSEAPTASPTVEPSPSPTPLPPGVRAWPPTIERPRVDGLGFLTVASVPLYASASEGAEVLADLPSIGTDLLFLEGPVEAVGYVWWKVAPHDTAEPVERYPIGWVRAGAVNADEPAVLGFQPECPTSPITIDSEGDFDPYVAIACFGSDDIVLTGVLACFEADAEGPTDGPAWGQQGRACAFESGQGASVLFVYGDVAFDLVTPGQVTMGTYLVTGHVDDAQASECPASEMEGGPDLEESILACRLSFVVTALQRLD